MQKIKALAGITAVIFVLLAFAGCAASNTPYPVAGEYPAEAVYPGGVVVYPADVYPYFWGGWYYYPFWNGTVWAYNQYARPLPNWRGHSLRHHGQGPPPRYWHGSGHGATGGWHGGSNIGGRGTVRGRGGITPGRGSVIRGGGSRGRGGGGRRR